MGWIRIRMDPELLPGSGSRTRKIPSWIWIRNKSFRIHNTDFFVIVRLGSRSDGAAIPADRNASGHRTNPRQKNNALKKCLCSVLTRGCMQDVFFGVGLEGLGF